jgi:phosphoglycerol transferase MdoB-like AlkP superfamily enzyme
MRFDISTSISWLAIPYLLGFGLLLIRNPAYINFINKLFIRAFLLVTILLMIGTQIHFHYYGSPFDQRVLGLYYEGSRDLLIMFWEDSHPIIYLLVLFLSIYLIGKGMDRVMRHKRHWLLGFALRLKGLLPRLAFSIVFFLLIVIGGRGTLDGFPLSRNHAIVTKDDFLNEMVLPPHTALRYVLQDYFKTAQAGSYKTFWPGSLASAMHTAFPNYGDKRPLPADMDTLLAKTTHSQGNKKPRHIFLFVMESYGGWTLLPKYRPLGLSQQLSRLADQGISVPCDSAAHSTDLSLTAILTSMPSVGFDTFSEISALTPYASSLPETFHRLGYKTRFFHGAGLGWRNMDKFLKGQGFDEMYGVNYIGTPQTLVHNWYVHDEHLYDFILKHLDDSQPTFNVILTISNHPPYELDWRSMGYKLKSLPPELSYHDGAIEKLGAFWYADQQMGRFVKAAEKRLPDALFAITGDHKERQGIMLPKDEPYYDLVPFVLYGKHVLKGVKTPANVHARHIDIGPTLYDLAADDGFRYYAMGDSIFDAPKDRPSYSAKQLAAMRALALVRIKKGPMVKTQ